MLKRLISVSVAMTAFAGVGLATAGAASAYNGGTVIMPSASSCRAEEKLFRDEGYVITHGCMQFSNGWAFHWYDPRP
ncbi:hypothetical protein [Cellulomonas taurus]|jgi:hypothetical protein|uniref:hypothetical protein n=1 Tax=Cellulomonas taurus TaxID=2729175 RepID=UPI001981A66E|nr:hypothetical protein [Cellulomonas taurus]